MLRRVAQPGIVEITGQQLGAHSGELHFARIDGVTFDQATISPRRLVRIMTSLAATVAHLHDSGIAHTRLTSDHILLSNVDGRPTLLGFREARTAAPGSIEFANDVAALGRLLDSKLRTDPKQLRARIQEDTVDQKNRTTPNVALIQSLRALVAEATDVNPAKRPTARRFAAALRLLAVVPQRAAIDESKGRHYRATPTVNSTHRSALIGFAVVAASVAVIAISWTVGGVTGGTNNTPISYVGPVCSTKADGALVTDIDGDGCGDAITFTDGAVRVNEEIYDVGQPGDVMAIGYWSCKNPRTLALLRPSNGKLYVFDKWPSRGSEESPRLVATVKGATSIEAKLGSNGCDVIQVHAGDSITDINPMGKNKS